MKNISVYTSYQPILWVVYLLLVYVSTTEIIKKKKKKFFLWLSFQK